MNFWYDRKVKRTKHLCTEEDRENRGKNPSAEAEKSELGLDAKAISHTDKLTNGRALGGT